MRRKRRGETPLSMQYIGVGSRRAPSATKSTGLQLIVLRPPLRATLRPHCRRSDCSLEQYTRLRVGHLLHDVIFAALSGLLKRQSTLVGRTTTRRGFMHSWDSVRCAGHQPRAAQCALAPLVASAGRAGCLGNRPQICRPNLSLGTIAALATGNAACGASPLHPRSTWARARQL